MLLTTCVACSLFVYYLQIQVALLSATHVALGRDNLGFFGEIHQDGLPSFSWLGSDLASRDGGEEQPEYIIIGDHEADHQQQHQQTNKMDYHHQPLPRVRKRHYDPVTYYEAVNDEAKTHDEVTGPQYVYEPDVSHYEPVSYHEAQISTPGTPHVYEDVSQKSPDEASGPQYVYDPYKHYQPLRSHRIQVGVVMRSED